MQPLIGITGTRFSSMHELPGPKLLGISLSDDYAQGVEQAGGIPMVIPMLENAESIAKLAQRLDGLVLAGGEDVDPLLYGEQPRTGLGVINPERDRLEQALIGEMLAMKKPILGICRGLQILNAVLDGTLYQDLEKQWNGSILHAQRARRSHLSHQIRIQPGTKLHRILHSQEELQCNSFHHQAVKDLAPGLIACAWDEEGLIEAAEHPDYAFVVGVQWHPENLWRTMPVYLELFKGLVEASAPADR